MDFIGNKNGQNYGFFENVIFFICLDLSLLLISSNLYNKRQCPRQQNNQQQQLFFGRKFFRDNFLNGIFSVKSKVGGLDLSRRDLDRDLDLDAKKVSVSTVFKS